MNADLPIYHIKTICNNICNNDQASFLRHCYDSPMSTYMMNLSCLHPKIRKVLKSMCLWNIRGWYFKESLF